MEQTKQKGYLKVKKLLEDIIEAITNRPISEIDKVLNNKLKELEKDDDLAEFKSKKDLINNLKEGRNKNAVHFAAAKGDPKVMQYLVEQGAELESVDDEGNTPLMIAIQHDHLEMCRFIIQQNPELISQKRKGNVYPVHLTTTGGKLEILKVLKQYGNCDLEVVSDEIGSPLEWSVIHQDIACLKYLLSQNVSTSKSNHQNGMPPAFILAVDSDNREIMESLYNYNKKVLEDRDSEGYGCVHLASEQGKINILKWLVDNGADIMMVSNNGTNALDLAYKNNHFEVINYLNHKTDNVLQRTNNQTQQELQKELHQNLKKKEDVTDGEKEEAIRLKEEGNQIFKKQDYKQAIEVYNQAFELDPYNIQVLTNRAACFVNTKQPRKALADCKLARQIDLNWSRTFYREGEAYFQLKEYPDSAASFWEALRLEPNNQNYKSCFDRAIKIGKLYHNNY